MTVTPGTRLGPYEIISRIGAGGMGEVFRALDTRLDRSVAIKVLPTEFARNAQLKLRFEREAKAISQLNHPHICTLYDVGDDYLVMELLEGETLADRIARGPLPLADVLKFGTQIAGALDRAHKAGIVHRDLKPGNIMLTKAGAKLLDFGLAKTSVQQVDPDSATLHHDKALTQEGTILGTFQYMAPEQLEAEEADARTDIFALGAVLYEMATGRRAFQGKTKTSLIAAIVGSHPPPVSQLVPLSPPALDHVIQKCLEKERDERWQSAHDVAAQLKWIETAAPAEPKMPSTRTTRIAIACAAVLAIALAAVTAMYVRAKNPPKPRVVNSILPPKGFAFGIPLLSPDGTMIAVGSNNSRREGGIWLRRVDELESKRLTTFRNDVVVAWSPDSQWIAYMTRDEGGALLSKMPARGGTPEPITPRIPSVNVASWGPDGTILYTTSVADALWAVRQDGSEPVKVWDLDVKRGETFFTSPYFLFDGKRFLCLIHTTASQKNEIWAGSLEDKSRRRVLQADALVGATDSHLYFVRDAAVYAQPFDEYDLRVVGEARRVADRVGFNGGLGRAVASVARNGALLYSPVNEATTQLAWYDRNGRRLETIYEDVNTRATSLSRDGTKVAATKFDHSKGANDIHIIDLNRGIRTKLTTGLSDHATAVWHPHGDRVFFTSDRDGRDDIYAQADDGATPAVTIWKSETDKDLDAVSPAGDALLVTVRNEKTQRDIWLVPVDAPDKRRPLVATEASEREAAFSPDGQWLSYLSDRAGGPLQLYIRRLHGGRTVQVSNDGAFSTAWSPDGSEVFVRNTNNACISIPLTYSGNEVVPGKPALAFDAPARMYEIVTATQKGILIYSLPDPSDYVLPLYFDSAPLAQEPQ